VTPQGRVILFTGRPEQMKQTSMAKWWTAETRREEAFTKSGKEEGSLRSEVKPEKPTLEPGRRRVK